MSVKTYDNLKIKRNSLSDLINSKQYIIPLAILIIMIVVLSIANNEFLQVSTFSNLFQSVAPVGIVAIGAMCVIITGGIDFTSGHGLAVAGVTAGVLYTKSGFSLPVLIITGIFIGTVIGVINGLTITKLKISPFIATLAMFSVLQGLSLWVSQGQRLLINDPLALWLGQGKIYGYLPVSFILFIIMCILSHILLTRTKFGIYTYAIGGNERSLIYSGVNVELYKILIYTFAGLCTGLGSVVTISRVALISPNISGSILMDAIASTIIGGTSISGGKGTIVGTFIGVLIMGLITMTLTFLNVDNLLREAVKGLIIILALLLNTFANKRA